MIKNKQLYLIDQEMFMITMSYKFMDTLNEEHKKAYILQNREKLMIRCKRLLDEISLLR